MTKNSTEPQQKQNTAWRGWRPGHAPAAFVEAFCPDQAETQEAKDRADDGADAVLAEWVSSRVLTRREVEEIHTAIRVACEKSGG